MLSKIGNILGPILSKDAVTPTDQKNHRENRRDDGEMEERHDDAMFFSLDAIQALLEQEGVSISGEVQSYLSELRQQGVASIPIRNDQPILEAIALAAARLRQR